MDIEEVKAAAAEVEERIKELVERFERRTGTVVTQVAIRRYDATQMGDERPQSIIGAVAISVNI